MDGSFPPPKRRPGRPRFEPNPAQRDLVRVLVSNDIPLHIIAEAIGVDYRTVKRAFRNELENGYLRVKAAISSSVVKAAMSGHIGAAKFWLIMRGGPEWRWNRDAGAVAAALNDNTDDDGEPWVIMMPPNGRDRPERDDDDPPEIEGVAEP